MKRLIPPAAKPPRHKAQTLVLMVLVLPAFMGAMGLATDVANFYFNYVKVQTGADASVLSGVKYLPDQPAAAISAATTYATSFNGIAATEIVSTTTSYDADPMSLARFSAARAGSGLQTNDDCKENSAVLFRPSGGRR